MNSTKDQTEPDRSCSMYMTSDNYNDTVSFNT